MFHNRSLSTVYLLLFILCAGLLSACSIITPADIEDEPAVQVPVRFLLSFDDGPSIRTDIFGRNPTEYILQQIENNPVQNDIKAIFFVQTRNSNGGGTEQGKALLRKEHQQGHLLGLHSASPRGHVAHTDMSASELDQSLKDGIQDIQRITGYQTVFVRPPSWYYDQDTYAIYKKNNLNMILTDISARDGVIHVFKISFRRRSHINNELYKIRRQIINRQLPIVDGVVPVLVTFHDPNTFTAGHMTEYLSILTEEAANVLLPVSDKPFYDQTNALREALLHKAFISEF
ncbi:MAG: polysaccharide deacetylase family protein [Gammaproteobacteria bacterium]|nr:polysaccharide deacetylase family protein [Gammaproteobacteria bacterium]